MCHKVHHYNQSRQARLEILYSSTYMIYNSISYYIKSGTLFSFLAAYQNLFSSQLLMHATVYNVESSVDCCMLHSCINLLTAINSCTGN